MSQELANTLFPPPPAYYKAYTDANVARLNELSGAGPSGTSKSKAGPSEQGPGANGQVNGTQTDRDLSDAKKAELAELKNQLEKPRADWVAEEGSWMCFGQKYDVDPKIPTAAEIGLPPYVDPAEPPQQSLPPLLHSFLHTFLLLLDTLTNTARIPGELEEKGWHHEGDQYIQHLSNLAANMMVSANSLRDVQAESALVMLMEKQLAVRREQTQQLKEKCASISRLLTQLRENAVENTNVGSEVSKSEPKSMEVDGV